MRKSRKAGILSETYPCFERTVKNGPPFLPGAYANRFSSSIQLKKLCAFPSVYHRTDDRHKGWPLDASLSGKCFTDAILVFPVEEATILEAEPGDVLFFSYFTLHGSMPNRSNQTRKSVLVQMHAGDDEIESENRHTNVQLVLRGWNHLATRSSVGRIR